MGSAHALVEGQVPARLAAYQVFGDGIEVGNTLMANPEPNLDVNTVLLPQSSANITTVPPDATVQGVFLWWSGSLAPGQGAASIDQDALLTLPDGSTTLVRADACQLVASYPDGNGNPTLDFYYCRADVTTLVAAHPGLFHYDGTYTVGDVYADPGHTVGRGCAGTDPLCQAKYAAWSLIFVYDSQTATEQRDVIIYDGFAHMDETPQSLGRITFTINGFLVGTPADAEISFFGLEGDRQLGAGPNGHCDACPDFMTVNGTFLQDPFNPPGNIYNSSTALGLDLDTYNIGTTPGALGILDTGATSATIVTGTGGTVLHSEPTGESVFLGWVLLRLNRPSPNFKGPNTKKVADVATAPPGGAVTYTVTVTNQGSRDAHNVVVTDAVPAGLAYVPNSIRIDGVSCTDAADADPCTVSGTTLVIALGTVPFVGANQRVITGRGVIIDQNAGDQVCNVAQITSTETPTPSGIGPACTTVKAVTLGQPVKTAAVLTSGPPAPDAILQYTLVFPGDGSSTVAGLILQDDVPAHVTLLGYTGPGGGAQDQSSPVGGANGRGVVKFGSVTIPAGGAAQITVTVRVDSEARFGQDGVPPGSINGLRVCDQGAEAAGFLRAPLLTDDPATAAASDPTCVTLKYAPDLSTSSKSGVDDNGGRLEPGDGITYALHVANSGNRTATVTIDDSMPAGVEGFQMLTPVLGAVFDPPPAGANGTGRLRIANLVLGAGTSFDIRFHVSVKLDAPDGTVVQNGARLTVTEDGEDRTVTSTPLVVFARPDLDDLSKTVSDVNGGSVLPGDTLAYTLSVTNRGNRPATSFRITDVIDAHLTSVVVTGGGGVFDPGTRTITWTKPSLAVNEMFTGTFTAVVVSPIPNGTRIANQAFAASTELPAGVPSDDPGTPAVDDPTVVVVVSAPALTATKVVTDLNGGAPEPGDALLYTISVRNTGTDAASNVVITDPIDPHLDAVAPQDGGILAAGQITWTLGAMAPGDTRTVRFTATIHAPLLSGTRIANQASLTTPEVAQPSLSDDPTTAAPNDPTVIVVVSRADFSQSTIAFLDLNGGAQQPGDAIKYTISVINSGNSPAITVQVQSPLDPRYASVVPANGGVYNPAAGTITWTLPEVDPLQPPTPTLLEFTGTLAPAIPDGTNVCETATITSPQSAPFTTPAACFAVVSRPDFASTTKTVTDANGGAVNPGDALVYEIDAINAGTQGATGVVVTDVVDADLSNVVPADGGVFAAATRTITWNLGSVAAKADRKLHFTATVVTPLDDGTRIANQGFVTCGNGCPAPEPTDDPATPALDDPTVVTVTSAAKLALAKRLVDENGGALGPGDPMRWEIAVTNTGTMCARNLVVTDVVDALVESVTVDSGGAFDAGTRKATWTIASYCPGTATTLTIHGTVHLPVDDGTPLCNQAQGKSDDVTTPVLSDDPATAAANDPTCSIIVAGALFAGSTKTFVDTTGGPPRPGHLIAYTLALTNRGNGNAIGVTVTDPIDASLTQVVPAQGGVLAGGVITWDQSTTPALAQVAVGTTVTLGFTARIVTPLDNGTRIPNQASITAQRNLKGTAVTDDPTTAAVDDPTVITVTSAPRLTASKTAADENGGVPAPGDVFLYTITLSDGGDAVARNVAVTDPVDANLDVIEVLDGGTFDPTARKVTWAVAQVVPGTPQAVRFRAAAKRSVTAGTRISNQASFEDAAGTTSGISDDPATPAPNDPTVITIVAAPDFTTSTKTVVSGLSTNGKVGPGAIVRYEITAVNSGPAAATGAVVTDTADVAHLDSLVPEDGGAVPVGGATITWNVGAVAAGASARVHFRARVRFDVPDSIPIANQALVSSAQTPTGVPTDDPATPAPRDPTVIVTDAKPTLTVTKTVADGNGPPVGPNDLLTYTITITDVGPGHAYNVSVADPIDPLLTSVTPQDGGVLAGGQLSWTAATTPALAHITPDTPAVVHFTARVAATATDGAKIANQGQVLAGGLTAPVLSDDPGTPAANDPTVVTVVVAPIIQAQKTVTDANGGAVLPGDTLTYTIVVKNVGTLQSTGLSYQDPVPPLTHYVPQSLSIDGRQVADTSGQPSFAQGPATLAVQAQTTFSYRVQVDAQALVGTLIANQMEIAHDGSQIALSDDPATVARNDATTVIVGGGPLLTSTTMTFDPVPVADNGNGLFDVNELINYRVTVQNTGDAPAHHVVLTDPIPPFVSLANGSVTVDGVLATLQVVNGSLAVPLGTLLPGSTAHVVFKTTILPGVGATVINQGTVTSDETRPELTDADGNEGNGNQPTVTPIGNTAALALAKSVADLNGGGVVQSGDTLLWTLSVTNTSTKAIDAARLTDKLDPALTFVAGSMIAQGMNGGLTGDTVSLTAPSIKAGQTLTVSFRTTIAATAKDGDRICNAFTAQALDSLPSCLLVGSIPGMGRLTGRTLLRGKVPAEDTPLPGLALQIFQDGDPRGAPIAGLVADADGKFRLNALPPGTYRVRALTSRAVQLGVVNHVVVAAGNETAQDVRIDPSGRLYDATTGTYVQDARVFLYYDDTDPTAPGQLVAASDLGPGQQGQPTPAEGFYKFDVLPGRKYKATVDPGLTYAFPSQIIPPTPGFAPPGPVVPEPSPSLVPNQVRTYYLRFDVAAAGQDVTNNHIPLDPLSSQIRLTKRSDRPSASLGDLVNYTVTVQNRSARDLTAAAGESVYVRDTPARGLVHVRGQAAAQLSRPNGVVSRMGVGSGFDERITAPASATQIQWGPFDLPAGATLTLTYHEAVGLDTRQGEYPNTAVLVSGAGAHLSNEDTVRLRVVNDPIFDQSLLIGKVFCDDNGDGRQQRGEKGVFGARVYLDTGSFGRTDTAGKYHLSQIDPGTHLVKLDEATLPPGATVKDPSKIVYLTRGLVERVSFGVACKKDMSVSITPTDPEGQIKIAGQLQEKPKPPRQVFPKTSTTVSGELKTLGVMVDGKPATLPTLDLEISADPSLIVPPAKDAAGPNLVAPPDKGYAQVKPVFRAAWTGEAPAGWTLQIRRGDQIVRTIAGAGAPEQIPWDGLGDDGKPVARDAVYEAQVRATGADLAAASPRKVFGVAFGLPAAPEKEVTLRGDYFLGTPKKPTATAALKKEIAGLIKQIGKDDQVLVEVHEDGSGDKLAMIVRTQKQAELVRDLLVAAGLPADHVKGKGRGSMVPLADARTKKGRNENKRLVVKLQPPPAAAAGQPVPAPAPGKADALVQGEAATVDAEGRFVKNVPTPLDGRLLVDVAGPDGRRVSAVLKVAPPEGGAESQPASQPAKPEAHAATLVGDLVTGAVSLDGSAVDTSLLKVDVGLAGAARTAEPSFPLVKNKLAKKLGFEPGVPAKLEVSGWEIVVVKDGAPDAAGPVRRLVGAGAPPPKFEWDGSDDKGVFLLAGGGRYRYRLSVETLRGDRGESPERAFTVGPPPRAASGQLAPITAAGTLFGAKGDLGAQLKNKLAAFATALKKRPAAESYRMSVQVAVAGNATEQKMGVATRTGKLKAYLGKLGLPLERIELAVTAGAGDALSITAVPPAAAVTAHALVDGKPIPLTGTSFTTPVNLTTGRALTLDLTTTSGQHAVFVIEAPAAITPVGDAGDTPLPPGSGTKLSPAAAQARPSADAELLDLPAAPHDRLNRAPALTLSFADDDGEFGGHELEDALAKPESVAARAASAQSQPATGKAKPDVQAADLVVNLPPRGLKLRSPELWISGKTDPRNHLKVNGADALVRPDGTFDALATLPLGDSVLVVEATDDKKNSAMISWPVSVTRTEHFLLVLAEGVAGTAYTDGGWSADEARLDGMNDDTTVSVGHVLLHGRLALYYKGRIEGGKLFKQYKLTAHVDTAKQPAFQEFFQETIDPTRSYAVYGDSAEEVRDANARGKLYVLVEADESKAMIGNFRTDLRSGGGSDPLFRYDRTVYGGELDFKRTFGKVKQEVKAFGTTGDGGLARDVNVFRATGGSLYYLRHGRIVEGGERVRVIVRDRDNGLELEEKILTRDSGYVIDYAGGRIMFKEPIASSADSSWALSNLGTSATTPAGGNPVYVEVTYEYNVDGGAGAGAAGVYVRDTFFDTLAVGAGIVGERRGDDGGLGDYSVLGADATWTHKRTTLRVEVASSNATDAGNYLSQDGGLTFQGLDAIATTQPSAGRGGHLAWKLDLDTTLGDFVKSSWAEGVKAHVYAQELDRGFSSGGAILEQGRSKYGAQLSWKIDGKNTLTYRHDAEIAELPRVGPDPAAVRANPDPLALDQRATYLQTLQWAHDAGKLGFKLEAVHQRLSSTATLADPTQAAIDSDRWGFGGLLTWKVSQKLALRFGQEVQVAGGAADPMLKPQIAQSSWNAWSGVATTIGADFKLAKDVILGATAVVRWNGDTGLIAGLKTPVGDDASLYLNERVDDTGGRLQSTSIVGGEQRFGASKGGKAYGEYQLEQGVAGDRNRAVLGVGHRWSVMRGLNIAAGYEHQQTFNAHLSDGTPVGDGRRDVLHAGVEYVRPEKIKASATVEVRLDDGMSGGIDPRFESLVGQDPRAAAPAGTFPDHGGTAPGAPLALPAGQRTQIIAGAAADWKWTQDQTFLLRFRIADTHGSNSNDPNGDSQDFTMARFVEATAGWALRPLEMDWLDLLVQYSFLYDLRPFDLEGLQDVNLAHVLSLAPVIDLPWHLRLSSKLAWKHVNDTSELIAGRKLDSSTDTLLWLVRLSWALKGRWEIAAEYRVLKMWLPGDAQLRDGVLVELDYAIDKRVRLGIGYNFSHFSDDELGDLNRDTHGLFFRVVGRY